MTHFSTSAAHDLKDLAGEASASGLLRYVHAAKKLGVDGEQALNLLGLDQQDIQNAQRRLPAAIHERLLMALVEQSQDVLFGLRAGLIVQPDAWSVLGYILINCASLGDAMARVASYERLVGELGVSQVEPLDGRICMSWHARVADPQVKRHMVENVLASWLSFGQWIADTKRPPCEIRFEHSLPDGAKSADYFELFGCPVLFDQLFSGIVIDHDMLMLPLRQADAGLLQALETHAQKQLSALSSDSQTWRLKVRHELSRQLQNGVINKSEVAIQLGVSGRTLQRYLRLENTHYQLVLDELRQEQAELLLSDPTQSFIDIAQALGYEEVASFYRRFKLWTGVTPGEYRNANMSE